MTRLVVDLTERQTEALDWIIGRGRIGYAGDDHRRGAAIGGILLDHLGELRHRAERDASTERVLKGLRENAAPDTLRRERDALREERDGLRRALEAERATRRRDRERDASIRRSLENAKAAVARLTAARDRYRDLAVLVEAALLSTPPDDNLHGLAGRVQRALRREGYAVARMPPRKRAATKVRPPKNRGSGG